MNDKYSINHTSNQIAKQQADHNSSDDNTDTSSLLPSKSIKMASKYVEQMKQDLGSSQVAITYEWISASNKGRYLSLTLLDLISIHFFHDKPDNVKNEGKNVLILTEYTMNTITYRANPWYKNEGPWFDWVLIAWIVSSTTSAQDALDKNSPEYVFVTNNETPKKKNSSRAILIPAKLVCLVEELDGEIYAIIHSCLQYRKKISVFTYRWQLEHKNIKECRQPTAQYNDDINTQDLLPIYHKVNIDCIHKHCLIVPYKQNSQYVMEVIDQDQWAKCFLDV